MPGRLVRQMTVGRIALILPVVAVVIGARRTIRDNSFLWHIKAGELQIANKAVLTADPFSFMTVGEHWRTQSWIADLVYGYFEGLAPLAIAPWITALSALLLICGASIRAYKEIRSALVAGVAGLWVMWLCLGWFTPRPVVISMAFFSIFLVAVESRRSRWALPILMWIWAGIHGGFIVGLGYLVLDGIRHRDRRRLIDFGLSTLAASLTAHGWGVWEVLLEFLRSNEALDVIIEWGTPDLFSLALVPFLGVLAALLVTARRGELSPGAMWVVIPFTFFAFTARRAVPLATIALVPWMAQSLRPLTRYMRSNVGSPAMMAVAAAAIATPFLLPIKGGLDSVSFPLEAAEHLRAERVFHDDGVGGYLIYEKYPERLVYIDDRAELFRDRYVEFVDARSARPAWRDVLREWEIDEVLLRRGAPLLELLGTAGWAERFSDENFVVLEAPSGWNP